MDRQASCAERVQGHYNSRMGDLKMLWDAECSGEEYVEGLGSLNEYGLCFDYVAPGTFRDQAEGYFRYQLSYGGPSDEFRYYVNPDLTPHRIEYWFLDWFDGARRPVHRGWSDLLRCDTWELLVNILGWFDGAGMLEAALREAE